MKHLSQQMLSKELRRPHVRARRSQLLESLRRPGISADEEVLLRREIDRLDGHPRYGIRDPVAAGAVETGPMPALPISLDLATSSHDSLSTLPHSLLLSFAMQQGLDVRSSDTKAQIVAAVWNLAQGTRS